MPGSRGNREAARPADLAEWQARTFPALRRPPAPSYDDALPDDLFADPEETRRILERLRAE